ncbi:MAG: hypothetical protein OEZ38_11740, partial [Gammaproteobacteria bacterium]|nr:hypothetical protein [Gammaproteobacteria bacterium]
MPILSKLSIVKDVSRHNHNPIESRRAKLIERLTEQKEMAQAMISGEPYLRYHDVWVDDPESGQKVKKQLPRKIRQWYWQQGDDYYLKVSYGARKLQLKNTMSTIKIGSIDKLVPTLEMLIVAVGGGELDKQLEDA